eukprot:1776915-Pleurochrysis_carterae.AAC.1
MTAFAKQFQGERPSLACALAAGSNRARSEDLRHVEHAKGTVPSVRKLLRLRLPHLVSFRRYECSGCTHYS